MLDPQLVGDHRDEFRVRGFRLRDIDCITEQMRDAVDVAASPSDFDRVTNRPFDAGRRCFELFGNSRIQRLCNGVQGTFNKLKCKQNQIFIGFHWCYLLHKLP